MNGKGQQMTTPGERIRQAREAKGLSQTDLARRVGVKQPSIQNIENGRTKDPRKLMEIAAVLDIPLAELRPTMATLNRIVAQPPAVANPQADFPVFFASPAAGNDEGWVLSPEPVEYVERPSLLATVRGSYGLRVSGSAMEPAYEPGDIVFVHPYLPPVLDSDVLLRGEAEGLLRGTIRRLVGETSSAWRVRQWNPRRDSELARSEWPKADRVVGKYNRK